MTNPRKPFAFLLVALAVAFATASAQAKPLKVGDDAPALNSLTFVRGDAVKFPADLGKKVYIVEFWATWCGPCKMSVPLLSELQQKYQDDLTVIGITSPDPNNTLSMVKRFVKRKGDDMAYTVAFDAQDKASEAYLRAAGAPGLPHAFIVDRKGKVAWQGNPLDDEMRSILEMVLSGRFDPELNERVNQKLDRLTPALSQGDWPTVRDGLKDILKIDPLSDIALEVLLIAYSEKLDDQDGLQEWVHKFMAKHHDDADVNYALSGKLLQLVGRATPTKRHPDLAVSAARAAYHAAKNAGKLKSKFATRYAQAMYLIGDLDRAITLQQEAAALTAGASREKARGVLQFYQQCKRLQETKCQTASTEG